MQGKLFLGMIAAVALSPTSALAAETAKREPCVKTDSQQQQQQRKQQAQAQRPKPQECRVQRTIPPVVDPTPYFLL